MLYDPKWEVQTDLEYDGVSLRGFIAWLETKDPNEAYLYEDPFSCAVAQYKISLGYTRQESAISLLSSSSDWLHSIVCSPHKTTFGAALKRARKLQAKIS